MTTRTVATRLKLDIGGYLGPLKLAVGGTREFMSEFDKAAKSGSAGMDKLSHGALIAGAGILAGFGVAIASAMKFDKQMSATGAAANATGKQLQALRASALQAGADTAFSATEAAQAEEELAKAGVSVKDILGGGLKGSLDLAAAGQLEVADAAEIAATAMVQFGLKGDKVPHVADLLSAAANKAQGSVQDVGMALKQGGLVASQFGLSLEETTGGIAAFASAGLIGSDAGTSLKTMLLALANPSEKSAALMEKLGINAYDAQGKFVGLAGLAGNLRDKLSGLTQAQRDQALAQIFGSDATRAANVLYRNGADGINKWTGQVNDSGNAARTAAQKMDNLAGDLEQLKGSLETSLIKTGSSATGALRLLAQTGTNAVNSFMALPGPVGSTVTVLGLTTGAALTAAGAYGVLAPKVTASSAALIAMGPAGRVANTALIGTAKYAAAATGILIATQLASTALGQSAAVSGGDVERYAKALAKFGETGRVSSKASVDLSDNLKHLQYDIGVLDTTNLGKFRVGFATTIESLTGLGNVMDESAQHARERLNNLDQALAQLVKGGHAEEARAAFERLAKATGLHGHEMEMFRNGFKAYNSAVADAADASANAGDSMETAGGQARSMARGLAGAVQEAGSLEKVLSGLNDINMSGFDAANKYQLGLNGMTKALQENKGAWQGSTTAAVENRQIVGDQIQTAQDYLGKQYEVIKAKQGEAAANQWATTTYGTMKSQIIESAVAVVGNRKAVTALVNELFRLPKDTPARVSTPGAVDSRTQVERLRDRLAELKAKQIAISQKGGPETERALQRLAAQEAAIERQIYIEIRTSKITINSSVNAAEQRNRWGGVTSFAGGGVRQAKVARPGTLVQWAEPETGGEAYVPRLGDPARSKRTLDVAAGWYGYRLEKMASGGLMAAAQEVLRHLRSGGGMFEDFSFHGYSKNLARYNDVLGAMFNRTGANWRSRASLYHFLETVRDPKPKPAARAAARPAPYVAPANPYAGAYSAPGWTGGGGGGRGGGDVYNVYLTAAPGADLRKAGQQIVECIDAYTSKGGRRP